MVDKDYKSYRITSNGLEDFDFYFLKLENEKENKVYSPLSIKYALEMLSEGASEETKNQIDTILGTYRANKYVNSKNVSFANALFVKDTFRSTVKETYINNLVSKFNAEVVTDSFASANVLNSWVNDKTLGLINKLSDDISDKDFILVNALAIDMEWKKIIQSIDEFYETNFKHENYSNDVNPLNADSWRSIEFEGANKEVDARKIAATINKYDIVKTLGEDNIRNTIEQEHNKWYETSAEWAFCDEKRTN